MAHKLDKPRTSVQMNWDVIKERVLKMTDMKYELIFSGKVANHHVHISEGNIKLGSIPSVSLIPIADCTNCKACRTMCYDIRNDCVPYRKNVCNGRAINSAIIHTDMTRFFKEIEAWLTFHNPVAFRWHIGGDFINIDHFLWCVCIARKFPKITFFAFTKNFKVVNSYCDTFGRNVIPENFKIIFSAWVGMDMPNPYNFPTAHPVFSDETVKAMGYDKNTTADKWSYFCPGDCTRCLFERKGCMNMKPGESVAFMAH